MSYDLDSGVLLYALGVLFGLAAFVFFLPDVVFGLSITVRAALLFLSFLTLLVAGFTLERDVLDLVAFALSAAAYGTFLWYVLSRYDAGRTTTFLALAASAGLFVGLGYVVRERSPTVPVRTATALVVVLALVGGGLVVVDAVGGEVTYDVATDDAAAIELVEEGPDRRVASAGDVRIGTLTATNEFVFARPMDPPDLDGCIAGAEHLGSESDGGDAPADVRVDFVSVSYDYSQLGRDDALAGNAERMVPIEAYARLNADAAGTVEVAIERGSHCDVDRDEPTLIVLVGEDARRH